MERYLPFLDRIQGHQDQMVDRVRFLSAINSESGNLEGVERMRQEILNAATSLGGKEEAIESPSLLLSKRLNAPIQLILCGHLDTVYGLDDPFQESHWIDEERLCGPGVADMKGGLVVLLAALEALESSPFCERVGWRLFCNGDEETGSIKSEPFLRQAARGASIALVYEPTLPDGALVSGRKGSSNYQLTAFGRSAHVGRNPQEGESAIAKMVGAVGELEGLEGLNVGRIEGGGPLNCVPDRCVAGVNVRSDDPGGLLEEITEVASRWDVEVETLSSRPPKPFDEGARRLFGEIAACGGDLGMDIEWQETGGVCDGNLLADEGLAVCDTMGVRGGALHTSDEWMVVESLVERAQLTALLLMKLGSGEIEWSA